MRIKSESLLLPGHEIDGVKGVLDAIIDRPPQENQTYIAVCCHPHPQHGGAMENKVVYTASRTFAARSILSIRFNFRGVGRSSGEYADGLGEQDDLNAVVNWAKNEFPDRRLILAGFSFGARIAAMQAKILDSSLLITIAPPIGRIDFQGFIPPDCPWLIIQGDDDELVDAKKVLDWAKTFDQAPVLYQMTAASHFFHGKLVELRKVIDNFCDKHLV